MNTFTKDFSDEEIARDWTLSDFNLKQISEFRKSYQLYAAVQICSIRLQGCFLVSVQELSPHIINYLTSVKPPNLEPSGWQVSASLHFSIIAATVPNLV